MPPPLPVRWSSPARPPFVGRRAELSAFEDVWAAVRSGARQVVFVGGEPGGGKSHLVAEVATTLHRHGATVLLGTCAAEFGPPYQPFVEPVQALLALPEPPWDGAAAGAGRAEEWLRTLTGLPRAPDVGDHRLELYDAATTAIRAAAGRQPLVLVLEDLHWAGPAALQLLAFLTERTADCPVLVLGTHRTTAPDRSGPLAATIAALYRLDGVRRMDLAGLDTEDVVEYLARDGRVPPHRLRTTAAVLRDQTGGNPFFLRELWREQSARGGRRPPVPPGPAPASVRDTILLRLDRLTAPARQSLELAAVVGEDVDTGTVLAAAEWGHDTTLDALDEAVGSGLLEPVGAAGAVFRFPHTLARQAVLELLPASRRAHLHARVAEVVEARVPPSERRAQRLAFHYAQAASLGHAGKAVQYLTEAARAAARSLAHEDAARWFEQAASLTTEPAGRDRLLLAAADGHLMGGDFGRARTLGEQVATTAAPRERLRGALVHEAASWRPGLPGHRAVELLTDALAGIPADPDDADHVRALASLGRALAFTGAIQEADVLGRRAIELARAHRDDDLLAHALQTSLWNGLRPRDAPGKLARATELSALADRTGDLGQLGPAAYYRGVIAYLQGAPAALAGSHDDLVRMARATGQGFFGYMAGCQRYARQFSAGEFADAERTCSALLELGESFGSDDTEGSCAVQTYMIRRETGAVEQVRPLVTGTERPTEHWAPGLLALYTELRLRDPAARLLHWLLEGQLPRYLDSAQWPCVLAYATEAALALADEPAARTLLPLLQEYAGLNLVAGQFIAVFGSADRYLGGVESMLGSDRAEPHLAAALDMDTRMSAPVHQAESLAALAVHLRRAGAGPRQVTDAAERARALAEPLGLHRVLRALADAPGPSRLPDGLTARETEVLRLLSEGLLNRQIARRLAISENTAANHVRSILAKTGSGNRTQAAMYAAAHGLLG
jgi:DNA-binding CsgD family transcriptional regulator/tetratricopeptide (TPR) repeat protein